ncbi:MAG: hypothetical protein N3B13_10730, partial [Deltaproteobacteria bacterium]|nr:hypothetical protein [Deltaproteobacteria bacterium]
ALETYTCDIDECVTNYANCNAVTTDGCEANIYTDANNCGGCGKVCDADKMHVVTPLCNNGNCDYDKCRVAWEDRNYSRADGCETYNYFPKTYGRVNISEEASAIIPIQGGEEGFFFVGNSGNSILAIRTDVNGNIIWAKSIGDNINSYYSSNAVLDVDVNGTISFIGLGSVKIATNSHKDLLILKLSDKGEILWKFTYYTSSFIGATEEATSIVKVRDGYIILGKLYQSNDSDILVLKLNNSRDVVWSKTYTYDNANNPGTIVSENAFSIYNTPDGNYVIGGSTSLNSSDFLLILINGSGDVIKAYNFGSSRPDYGKVIIPTDNGYITGGFTNTASDADDIAVIFYSKDFSTYWANTYGDTRANILINMTPSGNGYIISGQTSSANKSYEGMLMHITRDGNVIWQKSYGGKNWDMFVNAIQLSDTGFISFGRSISFTNDYDLWVVKTDKIGNIPGNCPSDLSTSLNLLKKTFPISLNNYPIKTTTLSTDIPAIPVLNVNNESININMQCST